MRNPDRETVFHFREFDVSNCRSAMKVGTDGVLLGAWALDGCHADAARVLDVGTGTGFFAILMAQPRDAGIVSEIPCAGAVPTPEELIAYCAARIQRERRNSTRPRK